MRSNLTKSIIVLLLLYFVGFSTGTRLLTPEDVVNLKWVTSTSISPDGNRIAYTLRVPRDPQDPPGAAYSEIWLINWDGTGLRRLTAPKQSAHSPAWSADGQFLFFLGKRGTAKHVQVYALPMAGGEPIAITSAPASVSSFALSPDGKWLAYRYTTPPTPQKMSEQEKGKDWIEFERQFRYARIHLLNLQTHEDTVITPEKQNVWAFTWSPTSDRIVYTATDRPLTDDSYMFKKIFQVTLPDFQNKLVVNPEAKIGGMAISPDGKKLAYLAGVDIHDPTSGTLFVLSFQSETPRNISGNLEGTNLWVGWFSNKQIITVTEQGVNTNVLLWHVSSGKYTTIWHEGPIFTHISWNRAKKRLAFAGSTPQHPAEVFAARWGKTPRQLTNSNPWLKNVQLAKQEVIEWKAQGVTKK